MTRHGPERQVYAGEHSNLEHEAVDYEHGGIVKEIHHHHYADGEYVGTETERHHADGTVEHHAAGGVVWHNPEDHQEHQIGEHHKRHQASVRWPTAEIDEE